MLETMKSSTRSLVAAAGSLTCLVAPAATAQSTPLAITNARILVMPTDAANGGGIGEIERGTLVVKDGKIQAVGKDVAVPAGATVIDAAGKVLMPGFVDTHSHVGGIGGADGSGPIQPEVRVYDSLNIRDSGYKRVMAGGITTLNVMPGSGHLLSGQTVYLKLRKGATKVDDWFYRDADGRPAGAMKMANGTNSIREAPFPGTRGKSASLVREQFVKAQEYAAKVDRANKAGKDGKPDPEKMPERNLAMEGLGEIIGGKKIVQHHTHRADDILTVVRIAQEFKTRVVLHHVSEAWKVAAELAAADTGWGFKGIKGTPCSVIVIDTPGGKLEASEATWECGALLEKAGVTVVFHTDDWITDSRLFNRSASLAHRAGMSRAGALRALTINGAKLLDLESRVGSLEVGKDADFILLSGDPLSIYTKIEQTFVEGQKVFDRADPKDRLFAVGGMGAGNDQSPYLCCAGGSIFTFGGRQWSGGNAAAGNDDQ